jgi:hypothetical protein
MISASVPARLAHLIRSVRGLPYRLAHVARVALDIVYWAATLQLATRLRVRRYARLVRRSGLFNAQFYLSQCDGDPDAQRDPLTHYLVRGAALGLEPSPLFDTSAYLARNPIAAAPRKNPLVHFIRSGGSAATAASASAPGTAPTPAGESLHLAHPFVAPPAPDAGRVLVIDPRMHAANGDAGSVRTFGIVKLLHELGCAVTFVSDRPNAPSDLEDPLRQLGIDVYDGFPAALAHLEAQGHRYRSAILSGAEQAFRYLPAVRAYCPHAKVIYDPVRPQGARNAVGQARLERMDRVNAACCDVVLVVTQEERHALLTRIPGARVEVSPQFHASDHDTDVAKGRLEILLFGRSLTGSSPQGDGTSIQERSDAWTA